MNINKLNSCMVEKGYNRKSFAKALGMPYYTLTDKIKGRTKFTIRDAERIIDALEIREDPERIVSIFFTDNVTKMEQ